MIPIGAAMVLLPLWGGLCAADQRALGSRGFHQPIVAAVGAGLILGSPDRAGWIGLWMQAVWAVPMPVGGKVLPDTGSAAVAAATLACFLPGVTGFVASILFGLLLAAVSIPWERWLRRANERREACALETRTASLERLIGFGIAGPFVRGLLVTGATLAFSQIGTGSIAPWLHQRTILGTSISNWIVPAVCLGLLSLGLRFSGEVGSRATRWVATGLALGALGRIVLQVAGR